MYDWYIGGRINLYLALTDDQLVADEFGLGSMQHNSDQKEEGANPLLSLTLMFGIMS